MHDQILIQVRFIPGSLAVYSRTIMCAALKYDEKFRNIVRPAPMREVVYFLRGTSATVGRLSNRVGVATQLKLTCARNSDASGGSHIYWRLALSSPAHESSVGCGTPERLVYTLNTRRRDLYSENRLVSPLMSHEFRSQHRVYRHTA